MFASLFPLSRRVPRACTAALDALVGPSRAAVSSAASTESCAAWGASLHQWPAQSAVEASLWTQLYGTSAPLQKAPAVRSCSQSAAQLAGSDAAYQAWRQSTAVAAVVQHSVLQPAKDGGWSSHGQGATHSHGEPEQLRHMATARGAAVPLQTARVEHAQIAWDSHGDMPAARVAPASRHADFPFPVKAFYIGTRLHCGTSQWARGPCTEPQACRTA